MKSLVKKEIRLVLPAWIVAVLLAMVQGIARPYDFYVAWLLFFGLTIMALSSIGREASLNTFSSLLAQPAERIRIWQVKLSVLAAAFLIVLFVWLVAFAAAFVHTTVAESDLENSYNLFITVCLIAAATFTGGLWTTLLLRQLASSFWLTMLVPATLSGFSAVFFVGSGSNSLAIAVLSVVIGMYSLTGFFFARWLYFRAQDVGWSGGVIALPEWQFRSKAKAGEGMRARRPLFALVKKELLLQQAVLTGATALLLLHCVFIVVRIFHPFQKNSAGETLGSVFWMLWLIFPIIVGSTAVAEERKLGVMENQLCLPASRRLQYAVKAVFTLGLGVLLGGMAPVLVEAAGFAMGIPHPTQASLSFLAVTPLFSAWLVLVNFFASSLARNFLQSIGYAILTFMFFGLTIPFFTSRHMLFFDSIDRDSILYAVVGVPTIFTTLLWLAWLNYRDYRSDGALLRRSIFGAVAAAVFVAMTVEGIYNRAWEVFEPAEPVHGPAQLSLANPPVFCNESFQQGGPDNLQFQVQLPDGHLWFDRLDRYQWYPGRNAFWEAIKYQWDPLPTSMGSHLLAPKWISLGQLAGIQSDGSLWGAGPAVANAINIKNLVRYGSETNWQQLVEEGSSVFLLKTDGTLWCWGTNNFNWKNDWPGFASFPLRQIGTNSDWCELYSYLGVRAQKKDGSVWIVGDGKKGPQVWRRDTSFEHISQRDRSHPHFWGPFAYARTDGTLWLNFMEYRSSTNQPAELQLGHDTNWVSAAWSMGNTYALKSDGTLWCWEGSRQEGMPWDLPRLSPNLVGIHNDWVALTPAPGGALALAADGSLWLWPDRGGYPFLFYGSERPLLKLPKQPKYMGNVLTDKS